MIDEERGGVTGALLEIHGMNAKGLEEDDEGVG